MTNYLFFPAECENSLQLHLDSLSLTRDLSCSAFHSTRQLLRDVSRDDVAKADFSTTMESGDKLGPITRTSTKQRLGPNKTPNV